VLIWLNGTFGVGKTQTAHELRRRIAGSVIADPEPLGFGIQRMYPPALRSDFQESPWWAPTTAAILRDLRRRHTGVVIVPMTLADPERRAEIFGVLREDGVDLRHVALLAGRSTVQRRLRRRLEGPDGWAMRSFSSVDTALRDLPAEETFATDALRLPEVVVGVGARLGLDLRYSAVDRLALPWRQLTVMLRHVR